jgi:hypothetical protein
MITPEESKVLSYLRQHVTAHVAEIIHSCLPGATLAWVNRIIAELEWLGYVTVFYSPAGHPVTLGLTDKGTRFAVPAAEFAGTSRRF